MRIAALVIGLFLGIIVFAQSCTVGVFVNLGDALGEGELSEENEDLSAATGGGIIVGFLAIAAAGFTLRLPRVAAILFGLGAAIAIPTGHASEFQDLAVWGYLMLVPTLLSYFGQTKERRWPFSMFGRSKAPLLAPYALRKRQRQRGHQHSFCSRCGGRVTPDDTYCVKCGGQL